MFRPPDDSGEVLCYTLVLIVWHPTFDLRDGRAAACQMYIKGLVLGWTSKIDSGISTTSPLLLRGSNVRNLAAIFDTAFEALCFLNGATYMEIQNMHWDERRCSGGALTGSFLHSLGSIYTNDLAQTGVCVAATQVNASFLSDTVTSPGKLKVLYRQLLILIRQMASPTLNNVSGDTEWNHAWSEKRFGEYW